MSIEQEKMIVESLPSLYPLQEFEEKAIHTVLDALPHWIPVTERLPETGQDVELCCGYKNYRGEIARYICIAYHVNRYEMKYSADWDEGCDEYREEDDEYYVLEGWYERIHNWDTYGAVKIYDLALAWRELPKLPEPFKEVAE